MIYLFKYEKYIKVDIKDFTNHVKYNYEYNRYKFYWNLTHDKKFLILYKTTLKLFLIEQNFIIKKYLDKINFSNYSLDLGNERLYYTERG